MLPAAHGRGDGSRGAARRRAGERRGRESRGARLRGRQFLRRGAASRGGRAFIVAAVVSVLAFAALSCPLGVRGEGDEDLLFDLPLPPSVRAGALAGGTQAALFLEAGAEALASDDRFGAVYFYTAATHAAPARGRTWRQLALSLLRLSAGFKGDTRLVVLCESLASARLADSLTIQAQPGSSLVPTVKEAIATAEEEPEPSALHSDEGGSCSTLPGGDLQARITTALHLQDTGHHLEATNLLCTSANALSITPTPPELRRGILTAATLRKALAFARVCGVMRVDGVIPRATVHDVRSAVEADWERRSKSLLASVAASAKKGRAFFESEDAAMRGDRHRFELRLPAALPFTQRNLTASPPVLSLLRLILGERLRQQEDGTARAEGVRWS